jgi:hypothetical protein
MQQRVSAVPVSKLHVHAHTVVCTRDCCGVPDFVRFATISSTLCSPNKACNAPGLISPYLKVFGPVFANTNSLTHRSHACPRPRLCTRLCAAACACVQDGAYLAYNSTDYVAPLHAHYTLLVEACSRHLEAPPHLLHALVLRVDRIILQAVRAPDGSKL